MTKVERRKFIENFKARRSSRIAHYQNNDVDTAFVGQVIDGSIDGSYEPVTDDSALPDQGHENPTGEATPAGQRKAGGEDSEPVKAVVNRSGVTREPLHVSGDNRNVSKATTIDISELDALPDNQKDSLLRLIKNNPTLLSLSARSLEDRIKLTALQKVGKANGPKIEAAGKDADNKKVLELNNET